MYILFGQGERIEMNFKKEEMCCSFPLKGDDIANGDECQRPRTCGLTQGQLCLDVDACRLRFQSEKTPVEVIPSGQRLVRHNPKAWADADDQHHQIPASRERERKKEPSCF